MNIEVLGEWIGRYLCNRGNLRQKKHLSYLTVKCLNLITCDVLLHADIASGDEQVKADAIRIGHYTDGQYPTDSREFARRIFYTVFMGSENRYPKLFALVHCVMLFSLRPVFCSACTLRVDINEILMADSCVVANCNRLVSFTSR